MTPRILFVAWRDPKTRATLPIGRLCQREERPRFEFVYIRGVERAQQAGFQGLLPFDRYDAPFYSDELFPLFKNRVMPGSRPDRSAYLNRLGLAAETEEPFAILARSAGRSSTDRLELFGLPSFDRKSDVYTWLFLLRGVRHLQGAEERISRLSAGTTLEWRPEPDNPVNPDAIGLHGSDGARLGYMPDYLLEDVRQLMELGRNPSVQVERVNLPPAPVEHRVLCRLRMEGAPGFAPFSSARFEPIPPTAIEVGPRFTEVAS